MFLDVQTSDGALDAYKFANAIAKISEGNTDNRKVHLVVPLYPSQFKSWKNMKFNI